MAYRCRKVRESDLETLMRFRMEEHVTKYLNTDPVLTLESQKKWFDQMIAKGEFYYWVLEVDDKISGVLNLHDMDNSNKRCTWGYYVADKKARSLHLSLSLEMSIYDFAFDVLRLNKVVSESFCDNVAAVKLHEICGCDTEGVLKQHIYKKGIFYDVVFQAMFAKKWRETRGKFSYEKIEFEG